MKHSSYPLFVDKDDQGHPALQAPKSVVAWQFVRLSLWLCALIIGGLAVSTAAYAQSLEVVHTYDTGLGENGAEIIAVRGNYGLLTNAADGSIDVLNLTNLGNISRIRRIKTPELIGLTSVAIHPTQDYFIAIAGSARPSTAPQAGLASIFRLSDGALLTTFATGVQPDSIAISPRGSYAVIANEAESPVEGDNGGSGSLTVVYLGYFNPTWPSTLQPTQRAIPSLAGGYGLSTGRKDDIGRISIDNTPGTLEPEYVSFSSSGSYAYITLQENNGILRLQLDNFELRYVGVGKTTHAVDIAVNGSYAPTATLSLLREPDGIDTVTINYYPYLVTADEGDTRDGEGNSGPRGGRTVTIYDAYYGRVVADTGNQLDEMAAAKGIYPDGRSNRGGSEPEGIDAYNTGSQVIAAVGLERANAVAVVDITQPTAPLVLDMIQVGKNPEGIKVLYRTNTLYVLTANEASGTLSVVRLNGASMSSVNSAGADQGADANGDNDLGVVQEVVESNAEGDWLAFAPEFRNSIYLPALFR